MRGSGSEGLAPVIPLFGAAPPEPTARRAQVESAALAAESDAGGAGAEARHPARATRRAENVAMAGLTRRSMSEREMRRLLESRDLEPDAVDAEIDRLAGAGLIDDGALGEHLVRTLVERKRLGRRALSAELQRRGIDPTLAHEALEEIRDDDELEMATELAAKRAGQLRHVDHETAVRRLSGFLARKGYSGQTIRAAVDAALPRTGAAGRSGSVRFE